MNGSVDLIGGLCFSCRYLSVHLTPAVPVVAVLLFVFVMCTLLRTAFSDPGIIPRATVDEAADAEKRTGMWHSAVDGGQTAVIGDTSRDILRQTHTSARFIYNCIGIFSGKMLFMFLLFLCGYLFSS